MDYNIEISNGAELDIEEAVFYYKRQASARIAQNFLKDFKARLKDIKCNPFYQIYYRDFRGLPLKKYPYIIFFQIDEENKVILINSVFQTFQNPNKRP